ncbi:MAG: pyridoxal phosphate-dependent aminotransferase [Bacteroidota bacterium]
MRKLDSDFLNQHAFNLRWAELPHDVIPFTAADWDIASHPTIGHAIQAYLSFGGFPYGPAQGLLQFREALAKHFNEHKNTTVEPRQILATNSAATGIQHLYNFLFQPNDEILIPDPVDFLLAECANRINVRVIRFNQNEQGINLHELKEKITEKTRAVVICNPHNPLGFILNKKQLQEISTFCLEHNLILISDEVWSDILHTTSQFTSALAINGTNTWVIYGFSKGFGMAGLRLGAILGPNEHSVLELMDSQGYGRTIEGVSTISQIAGTAALQNGWSHTCDMNQLFHAHLKNAFERITQETQCKCAIPDGTFVMTIHHPEHWDTITFCDYAREEFKVAVVPGLEKWFGAGAKNSFRISLATDTDTASEGIDRLVKAIQNFGSTL